MKYSRSLLIVLALLGGCTPEDTTNAQVAPPPADGFNMLFIGNSLTYWNTLPGMLAALADSAGVAKLNASMVVFPDYDLELHWARGSALRAIQLGNWDLVVLQQGPSSVEQNREQLIESTRRYNTEIRKIGGRPALYSVWPSAVRQQDFERASESYRLAAQAVDGLFLPVADAWRIVMDDAPGIRLYSADGLHPSVAGSYLAALVMFYQAYDRSPVGLPARFRMSSGTIVEVQPEIAAALQAAAKEAVEAARR